MSFSCPSLPFLQGLYLPILCALIIVGVVGCGDTSKTITLESAPLLPDSESDSLTYEQLVKQNGELLKADKKLRIGVIVKFLGNPFWKNMAEGMRQKAVELGVDIEIRAARNEQDKEGQLKTFMGLINSNTPPDILLVSPLSADNLSAGLVRAEELSIPVINVDGALLSRSRNWVGAPNYAKGVMAAEFLMEKRPDGGPFAIIMGLKGVYDAQQRTLGFAETLSQQGSGSFSEAARVHCDWDLQKALTAVTEILKENPDLVGIYCNNDTMVLGATEAVKTAGKAEQVVVIGTDGISDAIESIRVGELDATIDPSPALAGAVAVEVAVRVLSGEDVPRVVYTPQRLLTSDNINEFFP